jgi:hypothetical protein
MKISPQSAFVQSYLRFFRSRGSRAAQAFQLDGGNITYISGVNEREDSR